MTGFIDWDSFSSPKKPAKSGFIDWDSFNKDDEEENLKKGLIDWSNIQSGQSTSIKPIQSPSVWDQLSPVQKLVTAGISPISSSGLLGSDVRDFAAAEIQRGADSSGGFVAGLVELASDYLKDHPTLKSVLNVTAPATRLIDEFDSGDVVGGKKVYARQLMQQDVDDRVDQAINQIAGDPGSLDPLDMALRSNLEAIDTGVKFGAPVVTSMLTGGGISNLAANALVKSGLASVPKGLAREEATKFLARKMTTAQMLGSMGEGALQGIGERPDDPLSGAATGTAFGFGGGLLGVGIGKFANSKVGQKALESMKKWYDPVSVEMKKVLDGDQLLPEAATGEVVDLPNFDSGPFNVDDGGIPVRRFDDNPLEGLKPNKPQGMYVTTDPMESSSIGSTMTEGKAYPKNPLVLEGTSDDTAGMAIIRHYLGEDALTQILTTPEARLKSIVQSKYPDLDYSRINSMADYVDTYGAQLAKENNIDFVTVNRSNGLGNSESVVLDDSILRFDESPLEFVDYDAIGLSGHSSLDTASTEAINRMANGVRFWSIDPSGNPIPLANTVDAIDAPVPKGHVKVQINADGSRSVVSGTPRGLQQKTIDSGDFTIKDINEPEVGHYELDLDDPVSIAQVRSLNDAGIPNELSVKFDPTGPTSQRAAAQVPGTISMMDDLDQMYADLTKDIPNRHWNTVKKEAGGLLDQAAKTRSLGAVERAAHKVWGWVTSRGSIGGLRKNVSLTAAKAEFLEDGGKAFVQHMSDEILAQPRVSKELLQAGLNKLTAIDQSIADMAPSLGMGYQELNQLVHKAVSTRNYGLLPEGLQEQVKAYGNWMWNDLSKELISSGVREDIAKGMIYRNAHYLHQRYIGQNVDPDLWMRNRAIEDPDSFKQTMSWYKQKLIEELGDDVPKLPDGTTDLDKLSEMAASRVRNLLTAGKVSEKAPVLQKSATNSIDFEPLKTTQGKYELMWTDYLTEGATRIKADAEAALGNAKFEVDPNGVATEVPIFTRPEVDSMFDSYLENIPRASANRIRNNYVKMILDRKGIDLPPGQKAEYLSVRNLVDETDKEFLFREAIRQEDMPDFVAKFMGGHDTYTEAARDSLVMLAHDVSMVRMFNSITKAGLESGGLSPIPHADWEAVTGASKLGLGTGYDALYAPPMTARIFNASVEAADNLHWIYRFNNNLKASKILSAPGVMRNTISANWQGFFNGDLSPANFGLLSDMNAGHNAAIKSILNGNGGLGSAVLRNPASRKAVYKFFGTEFMEDPKFLAEMQDNIRRGVISGGGERELEEIANVMALQSAQVGDQSGQLTQDAIKLISRIYQAPDVYIKTLANRNRVREIHWAEGGKYSEGLEAASEETRDFAARLVNGTYQSYELTPTLAKNLSRLPGGPSFITFPVEAIRNFKNSGLEAAEYFGRVIKATESGDLGKAGRYTALFGKKLAHMTAATYGIYLGARVINEQFGITDKMKSAVSELVNFKGNKGGIFLTTDYDPDKHTMKFIDLANANPYPHIATIVRLLDDTGKDFNQKADEIMGELAATYAPVGIPIKAGIEAATGRSMKNWFDFGGSYEYDIDPNAPGGKLLSDNPTTDQERTGRRLYRFYRTMSPAVIGQAEMGVRAIADEPIGSRSFSILGELANQGTGLRENDVDLKRAYNFAIRDTRDKADSLRQSWVNNARRIPVGDTKAMAELRKTKQAELDLVYADALYYAEVARTMGFTNKEIDTMLEKSGNRIFIKRFRQAIITGQPVRIQDLWKYEQD